LRLDDDRAKIKKDWLRNTKSTASGAGFNGSRSTEHVVLSSERYRLGYTLLFRQ
jgi:hypothetical protein